MRAYGRTDMMKIIVAFGNFAKARNSADCIYTRQFDSWWRVNVKQCIAFRSYTVEAAYYDHFGTRAF
jgi:hypothetical protein